MTLLERALELLKEDQPEEDCTFWRAGGCGDGTCWRCRRRAVLEDATRTTQAEPSGDAREAAKRFLEDEAGSGKASLAIKPLWLRLATAFEAYAATRAPDSNDVIERAARSMRERAAAEVDIWCRENFATAPGLADAIRALPASEPPPAESDKP